MRHKKLCLFTELRRVDWIRTSGPHVPNVVRYRAALLPEWCPALRDYLPVSGNHEMSAFSALSRSGGQCRVDWIRTSDHLHPIQVRYRAAPPPELLNYSAGCKCKPNLLKFYRKVRSFGREGIARPRESFASFVFDLSVFA
jgi:hypothetical protein